MQHWAIQISIRWEGLGYLSEEKLANPACKMQHSGLAFLALFGDTGYSPGKGSPVQL